LASGNSSTFNITFTPSATGSVSGAIYLTNNSPATTVTIPVTGTGVAVVTHNVDISWEPSASAVVGYNTYRGTVSGGPYTKLTASPIAATSYDDATVQAGTTYYYVVTSVGTDSVESGYSNQAVAAVPTS
jgi:fibronectin type 3 domain-containing protein